MRKALTKKQRQDLWSKYNQRCAYCGQKIDLKDMQVDHINSVYVSEINNTNTDNKNLLPTCRMCNFYKSTFSIEEFRQRLKETLMENLKKNFNYRLALKYGLVIDCSQIPVLFYFEK